MRFYSHLIGWHSVFSWLHFIGDNHRTGFRATSVRNKCFLKYIVKPRWSRNLSCVSIFLKLYHSWCWLVLSFSLNSWIIILSMDWMNEFPCGMTIPYLKYWISVLRCNRLRFDVWYFDGSISVFFYLKNAFPRSQPLAGQIPLMTYQRNKSSCFLPSGCCICVIVMLDRPTHLSMTVEILHRFMRSSLRITRFIIYPGLTFVFPFKFKPIT